MLVDGFAGPCTRFTGNSLFKKEGFDEQASALLERKDLHGLHHLVHQMIVWVHEAERREMAARQDALTDPLTGISNRRGFDDAMLKLERELDRQETSKAKRVIEERRKHLAADRRRSLLPLAVVVFDFDNFKRINDRAGHKAGDRVLKFMGKLLTERFREGDIKSRLGGDEFAVVMEATTKDEANAKFEALNQELGAHDFEFTGKKGGKLTIPVSVSWSVETVDSAECISRILEALDRADEIMLETKEQKKYADTDML